MSNKGYKHILVATDGSDHALAALDVACDLARQQECALSIVHVIEPGPIPAPYREFLESEHLMPKRGESGTPTMAGVPVWFREAAAGAELSADAAAAKDAIGAQILSYGENRVRASGLQTVATLERHGKPSDEILNAATEVDADVVVMGTRGLGKVAQLVTGSVSSTVVHSTSCRCVLVK